MASGAKIIFDFNLGDQGWRELYYWSSPTEPAAAAADDAGLLQLGRLKYLATNAQLSSFSVVELPVDDNFIVQDVIPFGFKFKTHGFGGPRSGAATGADAAQLWKMILWRFSSPARGRRRSAMTRGSPATYWAYSSSNPFAPAPGAALLTASLSWRNYLATGSDGIFSLRGNFCIATYDKDPTRAPRVPITAVVATSAPLGPWSITVADSVINWTPGMTIKVGKIRDMWARGLSGYQVITSVAGNVLTLAKKKQNDCPIHYNGKGYVRTDHTVLVPITQVDFVRFVVRDTGGPPLISRGRGRKAPGAGRGA